MSQITLPQGQSLREIADRLGVGVDELTRYAGVADAEAPLAVTKLVDVPDGFLRSRVRREKLQDATTHQTTKKTGMNMWLALDIEQKRTRAAGGMKGNTAGDSELEGLAEARRTYLRFEDDGNELCIKLYANLASTVSINVRARAFAGQGCAFALRHLFFGDTVEHARPHAMSSAKAALLADPKLNDAHLAMALALTIAPEGAALTEAAQELESALRVDANDPFCLGELASVHLLLGNHADAESVAAAAVAAGPECLLARRAAAAVAQAAGNAALALSHWQEAARAVPTYAGAHAGAARALVALGRGAEAEQALAQALGMTSSEPYRAVLRRMASTD